jgi:polyisoprenyl-phosphate glycosyltransferase
MDIDLVIPIYNSAQTCKKLVEQIAAWVDESDLKVGVIFIDDGSIDDSLLILQDALKQQSFNYRIIALAKNYGQHTATSIGFHYSKSKLVATIDDDLQQNPKIITNMLQYMKQHRCDLVYGNYLQKKHFWYRNLGTRALQFLLNAQGKNYSMVTSCRVMRSSVIQLFKLSKRKIVFLDDFLLNSAQKVGACQVQHLKASEVRSRYSLFKLFGFAVNILLLHSSITLKLISRIGLLLSVVFFLMGCFYIYKKIVYDAVLGFTSLIVAIFFSTGLIMLSLGVIGEYIRRIWIVKQHLDEVIIADIIND